MGSQDNSIIAESQLAIKGKMSARFQQEKNLVRTNEEVTKEVQSRIIFNQQSSDISNILKSVNVESGHLRTPMDPILILEAPVDYDKKTIDQDSRIKNQF